MAENKVFMDTGIFTDIVEDIRGTASECVFPDGSLKQVGRLDTFKAGTTMHKILEELHKTDEMYRLESSESLPTAFLKMRDSMIAIDKACADSLTVEKVNIGGVKR
ncbi:MAG: hypothetical protein VZR24_04165 [Butyrivibrio hungatei]|jgi:hypothetical protein|nr:hypothetical protein [Butyrivibrio hungatei]